ncbi:sodium- and chloride-dependent glycine transporter 2-like isoform X3 [Penaeus japonicus]|uniref:sodium- and chloride-dependent glycine transporter 2-like isoform X3 n=1 Tax=Penaeus japonicus TaxID=27405 RepID=UPI001C714FCF|nr:sodium- and chloride-dependent glycine transporter 2-like isoform X3 [Penaeus japonicus]
MKVARKCARIDVAAFQLREIPPSANWLLEPWGLPCAFVYREKWTRKIDQTMSAQPKNRLCGCMCSKSRMRKTNQRGRTENEKREPVGVVSVHGDELPLVSSPQPRLASPTQASSSSPASPGSLPSTPLTAVSTTTMDDVPSPQASAFSPRRDPSRTSMPPVSPSASASDVALPQSGPSRPVSAPHAASAKEIAVASSHSTTIQVVSSPQSRVASPRHSLASQQSLANSSQPSLASFQSRTTSPQRTPVSPSANASPQRASIGSQSLSLSPERGTASQPVSPQRVIVSPQLPPVSPAGVTVVQGSRPTSVVSVSGAPLPLRTSVHSKTGTPSPTEQESKGVVVVVGGSSQNGLNHRDASHHDLSQHTLSQHDLQTSLLDEVVHFRSSIYPPRGPGTGTTSSTSTTSTTTTIPVSDFTSPLPPRAVEREDTAAPSPSSQQRRKTSTTPRKSASKGSGDGKRATHEKSKSVTIVVNDQHVTYSNTTSTYTTTGGHRHNGSLTNGDLAGLHATNGEAVAVNGHALIKGDLGGDSTRPSSAASTAGGTKVDPDIQYLSGETGGGVGGEECGEAWSSVVSGVCGVAVVVGAASVLRLPRLLYQHGAGSFLAAWCAVLLLVASPLAYLEAGLSQFSSSSALAVWRLIPIARGVGWSTVVVCFYWAAVVLGYLAPSLHYVLLGIQPEILEDVVSPECSESIQNYSSGDWAVDYYRVCVYDLPETWESDFTLDLTWPLPVAVGAAALMSAIIAACAPRGLAALTGVTSILAILGSSLQLGVGLTEVLSRDFMALWKQAEPFLMPQVDVLLQPRVWCAALAHVLLSLGLGIGLLMNFSARGAFRFTLRRHIWGLVILLAVVTALVSAVTVIQLTLLADDRGLELGQALDVISNRTIYEETTELEITEGVGMAVGTAMVTASHLLSVFPFPFTWLQQGVSTVVFLGLWCSGVTTVTICIHALIAAMRDACDCLPSAVLAFLIAPVVVAGALPTSFKSGSAIVSLLDVDILTKVVLWPPLTLTLAVTAVYGIHKVRKDFTFMLEATVSWLWAPVWGVFIPLTLLGVVVWSCVMDSHHVAVIDGPAWRMVVVWGLRALVLLPVPITAIYVVKSQLAYGVKDKVASSLQSSREWGDWGPQDPIEHHNWRRWREDETRPITSLKRRFANRPLTYTHSTLSSESSSTLTRLRNKYQRNGTASVL